MQYHKAGLLLILSVLFTNIGYTATCKPIETDANYEDIFCLADGYYTVSKKVGDKIKYGVANEDGDVLIPLKYSENAFDEESFYKDTINTGSDLYDKSGNKITSYDYIGPFDSDRAVVLSKNDDKHSIFGYIGFIDLQGKEIISPKYGGGFFSFSDGLLGVSKQQNGPYGFIDHYGEIVLPLQYDGIGYFNGGIAPVKYQGNWQYINKMGDVIIDASQYQEAEAFHHGLAAVKKDGKWGYINRKGVEVVAPKYDVAFSFKTLSDKPVAEVGISKTLNYIYGYIDTAGKEVVAPEYTAIYSLDDDYGYFLGKLYYLSKRYQGIKTSGMAIIDKSNRAVTPFVFENIPTQYKGIKHLFVFEHEPNEYHFFSAKTGEHNVEPYLDYGYFADDLAWVKQGSKFGFINTDGKIVIPATFKAVTDFKRNGLAWVKKDNRYGFINRQGQPLAGRYFDAIEKQFTAGLSGVKIDDKWGFINEAGTLVVKPRYDAIDNTFQEGLKAVRIGSKWGYIDKTGKAIIPVKYDEVKRFQEGQAQVLLTGDGFYPSRFAIDKSGGTVTTRHPLSYFQDKLTPGTETRQGMVIKVKEKMVQIQDNSQQCSQRDAKQNCINWIRTPTMKWVPKAQILPNSYKL